MATTSAQRTRAHRVRRRRREVQLTITITRTDLRSIALPSVLLRSDDSGDEGVGHDVSSRIAAAAARGDEKRSYFGLARRSGPFRLAQCVYQSR